MSNILNIALIITSVGLILSVILQSKGAGLGGLTGADTGGVFTARRGDLVCRGGKLGVRVKPPRSTDGSQ